MAVHAPVTSMPRGRRLLPTCARTLGGEVVVVPDDLSDTPTLLLVGCDPSHQPTLDGWARALAADPTLAAVGRVELALVAAEYAPLRARIDGAMAVAVAPAAHDTTLTAYVDVEAWCAAVGVSPLAAAVIVVGRGGLPTAVVAGAPTEPGLGVLRRALAEEGS